MTCYAPIPAWMAKKRNPNTGKSMVVFSPPSDMSNYRSIHVPCGQCIGCRLDYSRQWAVRCVHEAQLHDKNCYLTLTYDDKHVPWSNVTGEQTLLKRDLQLFWKSLRKELSKSGIKIRYFGAGEYGDLTYRPHYHAIVFGFFPDDFKLYGKSDLGFDYFKSEFLNKIWKKGEVIVANVSFDTCAYVARYCCKKLNGELGKEKYEGIEKEFSVMSRRPGIGRNWFEKYESDVYPSDLVVVHDYGRTRKLSAPRYYDNLLADIDVDLLDSIKLRRMEKAESKFQESIELHRLESKKAVKQSQLSLCKRSVE